MKTGKLSLDQAPPEDIPFRFFLSAPLFGILAGILIVLRGMDLFVNPWQFETIALTHLITLGWLSMIMLGAFYQMVPVLVGGHTPWVSLSRWIHGFFLLGILIFSLGLLTFSNFAFLLGALLLGISLCAAFSQFFVALFRVHANRPTIHAMRISILSLGGTLILGILSIGQILGWWSLPIDRASLKGIHIILALLGWVGCLIMGVGFHVITMFYLSTPFPEKRANSIILVQGIVILGGIACFAFQLGDVWKIIFGLLAMGNSVAFSFTTLKMIFQRKRKKSDPTLKFWLIGLTSLPLSILFLLINFFLPKVEFSFSFALLFLLGFAVCITNGMLYKIVSFLVWLHRFSHLVGKVRVPLMNEIIPNSLAQKHYYSFLCSGGTLFIGVVGQVDWILRLGGGIWIATSGILLVNLFKAVRMAPPPH